MINIIIRSAYMCDFLQTMLIILLTPEETLNTIDRNQLRFIALLKCVDCWYENWSVVAVMLEKKMAIVVRLR